MVTRRRILPFGPRPRTDEEPPSIVLELDGHPCEVVVWSPEMWGRVAEADRPDEARSMGRGWWIRWRLL